MQEQVEILIEEIRQFRIQYVAEVGSGRRAWPRSIKERIERLGALGISPKVISEKTGVAYDTILQWRYQRNQLAKKHFHEISVGKELTVGTVAVPSSVKDNNLSKAGTVTVTTPNGYKIESNDAKAVIEILKGLRCS